MNGNGYHSITYEPLRQGLALKWIDLAKDLAEDLADKDNTKTISRTDFGLTILTI